MAERPIGHSSMERWNPGLHGCVLRHPTNLDAGNPCRHDEEPHFMLCRPSTSCWITSGEVFTSTGPAQAAAITFDNPFCLYCLAIDDYNENSLELVFLFDNPAIDRRPFDAEFIKPADRQEIAFSIVKLPIVRGPFGRHIVVDV
jgi:hypothetical protein